MFLKSIKGYVGDLLIRLLSYYIPTIVAAIPSPALAAAAKAALTRVLEMIKAVTDENPDDAAQLQAIVQRFVSEDAVPLADGVIDEKLLLIQNEKARRGLSLLSVPVVSTMRLLSDEDPDNAKQAELVLDTFILDPAVQDFALQDILVPIIEARVPNPMLRAIILETLIAGLKEGAEELAEIDVFDTEAVIETIEVAKLKADAQAPALKLAA